MQIQAIWGNKGHLKFTSALSYQVLLQIFLWYNFLIPHFEHMH